MELKVLCDCGQKYAFDVEPIANQMPFTVNCPGCGKDGTAAANAILAQSAEPEVATAQPIRLRVAISQPAVQPAVVTESIAPPPPRPMAPEIRHGPAQRNWEKADMTVKHSLGLGFLGAVLGAILGVGIMFGWLMIVGFVFSVVGLIIGVLTGFGARWLYKGTDVTLGVIAAVVTFFATGLTFFLLFGIFAIMSVMVLLVSVATAYKIAG